MANLAPPGYAYARISLTLFLRRR